MILRCELEVKTERVADIVTALEGFANMGWILPGGVMVLSDKELAPLIAVPDLSNPGMGREAK
jgi:hypothetical protein